MLGLGTLVSGKWKDRASYLIQCQEEQRKHNDKLYQEPSEQHWKSSPLVSFFGIHLSIIDGEGSVWARSLDMASKGSCWYSTDYPCWLRQMLYMSYRKHSQGKAADTSQAFTVSAQPAYKNHQKGFITVLELTWYSPGSAPLNHLHHVSSMLNKRTEITNGSVRHLAGGTRTGWETCKHFNWPWTKDSKTDGILTHITHENMICSLGTPGLKPQSVTVGKANKYQWISLLYHIKIHCSLFIKYQCSSYLIVLPQLFIMHNSIAIVFFTL